MCPCRRADQRICLRFVPNIDRVSVTACASVTSCTAESERLRFVLRGHTHQSLCLRWPPELSRPRGLGLSKPKAHFRGLPEWPHFNSRCGSWLGQKVLVFQDARWRSAVVAPAREFTVFLGTFILERNNNAFDGPLCVHEPTLLRPVVSSTH